MHACLWEVSSGDTSRILAWSPLSDSSTARKRCLFKKIIISRKRIEILLEGEEENYLVCLQWADKMNSVLAELCFVHVLMQLLT